MNTPHQLTMVITAQERDELRARAKGAGLTVASYIRGLLGWQPLPQGNPHHSKRGVRGAASVARALAVECPACGAKPEHYCVYRDVRKFGVSLHYMRVKAGMLKAKHPGGVQNA